jgi:hypothetical protein
MDVVVVLVVVAAVVAAAGAYMYLAGRRTQPVAATERALPTSRLTVKPLGDPALFVRSPALDAIPLRHDPLPVPAPVPPPLFDLDLEPAVPAPAPPVEIRWWRQFDARSESLDDTARLRLIGDLGVVAKDWCVPLLIAAYNEERRPGHRQAALTSLAACRSRAAVASFRQALAGADRAERAIAKDALADLEPAPQATLRRRVERH